MLHTLWILLVYNINSSKKEDSINDDQSQGEYSYTDNLTCLGVEPYFQFFFGDPDEGADIIITFRTKNSEIKVAQGFCLPLPDVPDISVSNLPETAGRNPEYYHLNAP